MASDPSSSFLTFFFGGGLTLPLVARLRLTVAKAASLSLSALPLEALAVVAWDLRRTAGDLVSLAGDEASGMSSSSSLSESWTAARFRGRDLPGARTPLAWD